MIYRDYVLDVGCGKGNLEVILERRGFENLFALDSSKMALAELKLRTRKSKTSKILCKS